MVALLGALLLTLQAHEHARYARASLRGVPQPWHVPPAVLVCVPCKGVDLNLADNLRGVLSQDYPNYRVRFVVESPTDPACDVIRRVMSQSPVKCELLVAGQCCDSGQKVHNLVHATAELPEETEVLAFFDSDARPEPTSLSRLVHCVCRNHWHVATGYRWLVPRRPTLANLTLASINASVAGLFKRQGWNLIWGGGWALTRDMFQATGLRDAWRGTLSDDLVASRVLRRAGAKVIFEPGCVALSAVDVDWRGAMSFLRRQFVICRCYAPAWWWVSVPLAMLQPAVLLGGVILAVMMATNGNALWVWPMLISLALYALSVIRASWRQSVWCAHFREARNALRAAARFDCWASPWSCLFAASTMLAAAVGRSITWRGICYHIGQAGRITLLGRVPTEVEQRTIQKSHHARRNREVAASAAQLLVTGTRLPTGRPAHAFSETVLAHELLGRASSLSAGPRHASTV